MEWTDEAEHELLTTIDEETDRLNRVVGSLLDMSRLQAGAIEVHEEVILLDEVLAEAVASIGAGSSASRPRPADDVPPVIGDEALLERAFANIIANAVTYSRGEPVLVHAGLLRDGVDVRVADRGPGVPPQERETHLPAVQTGRRHPQARGRRPRARHREGLRGSHGGYDRGGRHARRRSDHRGASEGSAVTRVLVVDDEPQILRALGINLRARDFAVDLAADGETALQVAARNHPDVVVLDLGLPGMDGLEVIEGLRGWTSVPIIVLSVRDREADKVAALDAGADDYVTKPFGMDELLARMRAALRRVTPADEPVVVETPDFAIDLAARRVTRSGEEVRLTATEWHILEVLVRNAGRLVTQRQLLQEVWGPKYETETHYLRVYVGQLRRKLEPVPSEPRYFLTAARMGYRFEPGPGQ